MLPDFGMQPEDLPKTVIVWHHKKQYAVMKEALTFENLDLFIQKIYRNAVERSDYAKNWKMHQRNCAQVRKLELPRANLAVQTAGAGLAKKRRQEGAQRD